MCRHDYFLMISFHRENECSDSMHILKAFAMYHQFSCQISGAKEITRSYFQEVTAAKSSIIFFTPLWN